MKRVNFEIINPLLFMLYMSLLISSCKVYKLKEENKLAEKINGHWIYDAKAKLFSYDYTFNTTLDSNARYLKKMNKEQIQKIFGNASQISSIKKADGSSDGYYIYYYLNNDCFTTQVCRKFFFYYDDKNQLINWGDLEGTSQD
jgi:hypothetical protein